MNQKAAEKATSSSNGPDTQGPDEAVKISYFTDPLCCWSWALQPQLDRLLHQYGAQVRLEYRMGGLLDNWKTFRDPLNNVYAPTQMGPLWAYASETTQIPIDAAIWVNDPPASSYPACLAVKCMQLQGDETGARYLYKLREAVMTRQQNIGRKKILLQVAEELANEEVPGFHFGRFENDLEQKRGAEAFQHDMAEKKRYGINRLPTLVMKHGTITISLTGYRTYDQLEQAVRYLLTQNNGPAAAPTKAKTTV